MVRFSLNIFLLMIVSACAAGRRVSQQNVVFEKSFSSMGTFASVRILQGDRAKQEEAYLQIVKRFQEIEARLSHYQETSEVSKVRRSAGSGDWIPVSRDFALVLEASLEFFRRSKGAFDVTVAPLVEEWGLKDSVEGENRSLPDENAKKATKRMVGSHLIEWNSENRRVRLKKQGMGLDFGGIGKGYALDEAISILKTLHLCPARLDFGGQIAVCNDDQETMVWKVEIRNPFDPEGRNEMMIKSGSVATSGSYYRYFQNEGKVYSHIVDPKKGVPMGEVQSVSVWAPTALEADAWSTAFFVGGRQDRKRWIKENPELGVFILYPCDKGKVCKEMEGKIPVNIIAN